MKNFIRAVRIALRHRLTLLGIVVSSMVVALLWGANIGTAYPFIQVVFQRDSMHQWMAEKLEQANAATVEMRADIAGLEQRRRQVRPLMHRWYLSRQIDARCLAVGLWENSLSALARLLPRLPDQPFPSLLLIVSVLLVSTAIKCTFLAFNLMLVTRIASLTNLELRNHFYRHTLQMELSTFDKGGSGALMSRFTGDLSALTSGLSILFGKTLREPLKMVVCLIGAALISWQLLVLCLVITPAALLITYFLARSIKRANHRAMEEMAQIFNRLSESFHGIKVIKAYTMERVECSRFLQRTKELYFKTLRITFYSALTRLNNELLGVAVTCLALLAGGYLVLSGQTRLFGMTMTERPFTFAAMMLFFGFLIGLSDPVRKLAEVFNQLQRAAAAADRIFPLLDRPPTITDPAAPRVIPAGRHRLVFDHVSFAYVPQHPVLRDISLTVAAGECLAIVGPNGCGKTTLANLIPRFYDPSAGAVRVGQLDVRHVRLRDLRRQLGLVTQQTHLFNDTIANNIRYGSPHALDEEVIAAAQKAHAHRFIVEQMENGYQTGVGTQGERLSGGQRQRIALARAILRDPSILILDEATSQIDQESERLIHKALAAFIRGRTTIIITHRTSTLALADRIVVMEAGRIVDVGAHDQLLNRCPLYQRLYRCDFKQSA